MDLSRYCPGPHGSGNNTPHCLHLIGSNAPPFGTPERRVGQILQCCWCGDRESETHGPYLKDCRQPGVSR